MSNHAIEGTARVPLDTTKSRLLALALLILVAALFFLPGYSRGLPFYEDIDEHGFIRNLFVWRGLLDEPILLPGYPPGIFVLQQGIFTAFTIFGQTPTMTDIALATRLLAALTSIGSACLIFGSVNLLTRSVLVSFWAALLWICLPLIPPRLVIALTEPWLFFFGVAALYAALRAMRQTAPSWAVASTLLAIGSLTFKYPAFYTLGFGLLASLWGLYQQHGARKAWLLALVAQITFMAGAAFYLLFVYDAWSLTTIGSEGTTFTNSGFELMLNPRRIEHVFSSAATLLSMSLPVLLISLTLAALFYLRVAALWAIVAWIGVLAGTGFYIWFAATYYRGDTLVLRYVILSSGVFVVLLAAGAQAGGQWLQRRTRTLRLTWFLWGALSLLWLLPNALSQSAETYLRTLPDTRLELHAWGAATLPLDTGTTLVTDWRWFARDGGYFGPPVSFYPVEVPAQALEKTIDEYLQMHIRYAAMAAEDLNALQREPGGAGFLSQLVPLKRIPPLGEEERWRGPIIHVFSLRTMEQETDIAFEAGIRLVGYDLEHLSDQLVMRPWWSAVQRPERDYQLFVHLYPEDEVTILAQIDDVPGQGSRTTSTWDDPDELIPGRELRLSLAELPPGRYQLALGLYDPISGVRLRLIDGSDYFQLTTLRVES